MRWPKYWSFSFNISPSKYLRLIFFKIALSDLLTVQGTLKSLLQYRSSKASILCHSAFFMVDLSHPYMTTGKTTILTIQTFVSKVMSLLFNTLSRFVIAFLPSSNYLLISWLQSCHHSMVNSKRQGGNSDRFPLLGLKKSLQMATAAKNSHINTEVSNTSQGKITYAYHQIKKLEGIQQSRKIQLMR